MTFISLTISMLFWIFLLCTPSFILGPIGLIDKPKLYLIEYDHQEPIYNYLHMLFQKSLNTKELKDNCDENQLLLQLARLYVTSPERIVSLLSTKSLRATCQEVSDVLQQINATLSDSIPLPKDNLYMKLYNGLDYFNSQICLYNSNSRGNHLTNHIECIQELHDDLIECEGPPDWFEKSNKAVVCQYYNDIINCNYVKAAMLCGLKPALMLRTFSNEIMKKIVNFKCKVSRSLPHVDDPMPARGCFKRISSLTKIMLWFMLIFNNLNL